MSLTKEQLTGLTELLNERRREFSIDRLHPLSPGEVRLILCAVEEWQLDQDMEVVEEYAESRKQAYDNGYQDGLVAAETKTHDQAFTRGFEYGVKIAKDKAEDFDSQAEAHALATEGVNEGYNKGWQDGRISRERELALLNGGSQNDVEEYSDSTEADGDHGPDGDYLQETEGEKAEYFETHPEERPEYNSWDGNQPAPISPTAAATLGPEHTVVTPLVPRRNAEFVPGGVTLGGNREPQFDFTPKPMGNSRPRKLERDHVMPTVEQLVAELKRQAAGTKDMPTKTTFDTARPANWGTAQAQISRLDLSWEALAEKAGLKMNPRAVRNAQPAHA